MKIIKIVLIYLIYCIFSIYTLSNNSTEMSIRNPKFFPFWGVGLVRFENGICGEAEGLIGTCYTKRQCAEIDGIGTGRCANKIGVCCVVQRTCGETTSQNNTYFVSTNFPNRFSDAKTCSLTIQKCNSDICQVRIDFLTLNLAQPDATGACTTDALYVIGGASPVPIICGENSGQHIYVDFNGDDDIQLIINTNALSSIGRSWNIKISQIGCNCPTKAPTGCLMYYTALSGTVKSFNYGSTGSQLGTRQLINNNYGVCVEMQPGYCSITWSASPGDPFAFTLTNDTNAYVTDGTIGTAAAALSGNNCTSDFVVIPNPVYNNGTSAGTDRFCGNGFLPVTSSSKPFMLTVVTNGNETSYDPVSGMLINDVANRGFSLSYMQKRCSGSLVG